MILPGPLVVDLTWHATVNALPETSFVVVNYRVAVDSSPQVVIDKITERILPLAKKHSLDLDAFGQKFSSKSEVFADGLDFMNQDVQEVSGGELKIVAIKCASSSI